MFPQKQRSAATRSLQEVLDGFAFIQLHNPPPVLPLCFLTLNCHVAASYLFRRTVLI